MFAKLIPQAYAVCEPGISGIDLGDCLSLGAGKGAVNSVDAYKTPAGIVNLLVPNLFVVAGIILFFMMIFAGFKFISGATKGKDEAQQIMTTAVAGFLVMFVAYWIVQIVKIVTGADIRL